MPRKKTGERILGPYAFRDGFRLTFVAANGERSGSRVFPTEQEAEKEKQRLQRQIDEASAVTINEAIDDYREHLKKERSNRPKSVDTTIIRLHSFFFEHGEMPIAQLNSFAGQRLYKNARERIRPSTKKVAQPDTHRNELAEAKTFLNWCVEEKKLVRQNPLAQIEGKGRRKHGVDSKPQLRIDEARMWLDLAMAYADHGEPGAVAAMMTLLMGMRRGEVVSRQIRDVDDEGRLLWTESKSAAGRRQLDVPEPIRSYLRKLIEGRRAPDYVFPGRAPVTKQPSGHANPEWVRKWVQRICRECGVQMVTAHSMRGLHATLAKRSGATSAAVAAQLGHSDERVSEQSYIAPDAKAGADQNRVLHVLTGGRK